MKHDTIPTFEGRIQLRDLASQTLLFGKSNLVTYTAADILARVLAGEPGLRPAYVGFLYGASATPPDIVDPDTMAGEVRRIIRLSDLQVTCQANTANVAVAALARTPATSLSTTAPAGRYTRNVVQYTAHTGMISAHLFPLGTGGFAAALQDLGTAYVYQVILLSKDASGTFLPFAISQLGTAPYVAKVSGREQAVLWDIEFK